jgi:PAS domain S-box-containing protein
MDFGKKRLLLVEDEAIIALLERQELEEIGYSVAHALRGEEAVAMAKSEDPPFDAILMDINLGPGMDGTQAAEAILKAVDIPIVFLSSHTEPRIVGKTEGITSYGYVVKNSGIVVLDASIKMALKLFNEKAERARAERQVLRMKNLYAALSQINEAIVRVGSVEELAGEVSRVAVSFGRFKFAWVGRHDPKTREVRALGFFGEPEAIVTGIKHSSDEAAEAPCLCGRAIREGRPNVANDLSIEAEGAGARREMERAGIKAAAVFPVRVGDEAWGVFGVYSGEAGIFREEELALLEEAAMDIGYAIDNLENEARRRRAERMQVLSAEVLGILNQPLTLSETSSAILRVIKEGMGLDAAGIRLKDRDDFPYFGEEGFEDEFLAAENSLVLRDDEGLACRDEEGRLCLECTCGLVLAGKCGPAGDNVTEAGSMWTNDSLAAAEALRGDDPRLKPRDRCVHEGYLSVALIPIRAAGEIIGLLHLNDRRRDRFIPEDIRFLEGLTSSFGIAVERKRSEARLLESEARYRLIADNAADVIWVLDPVSGRFTYVSPSVLRLRGYTPEEVMAQDAKEALTPESAEHVARMISDTLPAFLAKGSGTMSFMTMVDQPRKDGSVVHTEVTTNYVFDDRGKAEVIGVTRDITDIKRAEDRLQASEAIFRAVFDNAPVGISILDSDRRVLESNGMLERIVRLGRDGLADGAHLARRYIREDGTDLPPDEMASSRAILEKDTVRDMVTGIVLDDGSVLWTQVSAAPLGLPDPRIVLIVQDITDRKAAEAEGRRQLEEKELLLKEVHHRIKNNIASIEALLSMQAELSGKDEVKSALRESIARVGSIRILYEKLLTSDDYQIVSTRGYIASLVDSLVAVFPDRRGVSIEQDIEDFPLSSRSMVAIGIIINELITNIFKHAFEGRDGGRISMRLTRPGTTARLVIEDDGVGIGDGVDAKRPSGFGLMIVKMMTQQLDGSFSMASEGGTTSIVEFRI